jgi:sialate O-acetylesterase
MVLQQYTWVNLWGRADPGEQVTVLTGWDNKEYSVLADVQGNWIIKLFSGMPGGPYTLTFSGTNRIVLNDVMIGEVWVCSGQSNMEFSFMDLGGWKYYPDVKRLADSVSLKNMRLCTIGHQVSRIPLDSAAASWETADTASILRFSATAFYFGLELEKRFHVPIGLIVSAWSGTPAESWTPEEYLKYTPGLELYMNKQNGNVFDAWSASSLFNGMIHPLRKYTIKGFIWYQGESNRLDYDHYDLLMGGLIRSWRKYWEQPELSFNFVQIAPFDYRDFPEASGFLREAQQKTLEVENTGMVVTLDIGDLLDIHPKNKREVGRRLALLAFARAYGQPLPGSFSGPVYWFSKIDGNHIQVYFKDTDMLLGRPEGLTGFRIAGEDAVFKPAKARIEGGSVNVWSPGLPAPKYVRYAFLNTDTASFFDQWGLPAGSFRTDSIHVHYRQAGISAKPDQKTKGWMITFSCRDKNTALRYTTDGSIPVISSSLFTDTLRLNSPCTLTVRVFIGNAGSEVVSTLNLVKNEAMGVTTTFRHPPAKKYSGNELTLTDGILGSEDYRDGRWIGIQGAEMELTQELEAPISAGTVSVNFLADTSSWIIPPEKLEILVKNEKGKWTVCDKLSHGQVIRMREGKSVLRFSADVSKEPLKGVRIKASHPRELPAQLPVKTGKSWFFTDEVLWQKEK